MHNMLGSAQHERLAKLQRYAKRLTMRIAVLREAGKNSTWRLPGNGVGDAKHTPGVGAGGNPVRIRTCVNLTFPAAKGGQAFNGVLRASLASLST